MSVPSPLFDFEAFLALAVWISRATKEGSIASLSVDEPTFRAGRTAGKFGTAAAGHHPWIQFLGHRQIAVAGIASWKGSTAQEAMLAMKTKAAMA